jgi:hypothetical protein
MMLERLGNQVDGPRQREHGEDDSRQVHATNDRSGDGIRPARRAVCRKITPVISCD